MLAEASFACLYLLGDDASAAAEALVERTKAHLNASSAFQSVIDEEVMKAVFGAMESTADEDMEVRPVGSPGGKPKGRA